MRHLTALLAVGLLATACSDDGAPPAPTIDRSPAPPPEGLLVEVSLGGGSRTLTQMRGGIESRLLLAVIPETPGQAFERLVPLPEAILDRVPGDADVRAVILREDEDRVRVAVATRVHLEPSADHPLGVGVVVAAGAPHGARWLGGPPGDGDMAVALIDDVLVAARDEPTLDRALRYLAFTLLPQRAEPGLQVRVVDGVVAGPVRQLADAALGAQLDRWREAARAERARHDEPPTFGDPEAVIALVERAATTRIAFLPDVGEVQVQVAPERGSIVITMDAAVRSGSPLARELADAAGASMEDLLALPADTALAWTRADPAESSVDDVARIGGDRMTDAARSTLDALWESYAAARGDRTMVALGASPRGAWAMLAAPDARGAPDGARLLATTRAGYVADVAGAVLGCPGATAAARYTVIGGEEGVTHQAAPLCTPDEGPPPSLSVATAAHAFAIAVSRAGAADTEGPAPDVETVKALSGIARGQLGSDPDVSRAAGSIPDPVLVGAVVAPARALPALAIVDHPALRRATAQAPGPRARVAVLGLTRTSSGLSLRVVARPESLDDFADLAAAWHD